VNEELSSYLFSFPVVFPEADSGSWWETFRPFHCEVLVSEYSFCSPSFPHFNKESSNLPDVQWGPNKLSSAHFSQAVPPNPSCELQNRNQNFRFSSISIRIYA